MANREPFAVVKAGMPAFMSMLIADELRPVGQ
jgi:hypothetical protein